MGEPCWLGTDSRAAFQGKSRDFNLLFFKQNGAQAPGNITALTHIHHPNAKMLGPHLLLCCGVHGAPQPFHHAGSTWQLQ